MHLRKAQDDPSLPDEVRKGLCKYEAGQRILAVSEMPGYKDLLDLLREDIENAARKVRGYRDSDPNQVLRALAELQGKEDALTYLEYKVKSLTALAENPPSYLQGYLPTF